MGTFHLAVSGHVTKRAVGVLPIAGDSITAGGYGVAAPQLWGAQLAALIAATSYVNAGHSGEMSGAMVARQPTEISPVYSPIGRAVAILEIGTNNLGGGFSVVPLIADAEEWLRLTQNAGFWAGVCTILPRNASFSGGATQASFDAARAIFNAHVRTGPSRRDFVIDFDAEPGLANPADPAIYIDGVHPTAAGAALMAAVGAAAIM